MKSEDIIENYLSENNKFETSEIKAEPNKKSQCSTCGQKFRFLKALQKHEARHEGDGGFICKMCGMQFKSSEAREKHREKEHKVLRCRICNIRFKSENEYLYHINNLHDGRDRELSICSTCGKQFKTKGELTHHVASKCGTIKKYQCNVCLQTLMTAGSLHNHMLRHSGQRTFMCRFCAKTFLTAGQLTVHERIHTQEKAFVCEICNKGFCHRQSLITHNTLHTGIKPYQCESCGNSFSCVGNLLKHRTTHADTCGKIPLTTHRVLNPTTKLKVQVNTPSTSKLRKINKCKNVETDNKSVCNDDSSLQSETSFPTADFNNVSEQKTWISPPNVLKEEQNQIEPTNFDYLPSEKENLVKSIDSDAKTDCEDNFSEDCNQNSDSSDDSLDLNTRKLKLDELKKVAKNKKIKNNKKRSSVDQEKLQKFIEERGFDNVNGMNCKYCGNHYSIPLWLMKHEQKHEDALKNGNTKGVFKCSCCSETFETKTECISHRQSEHVNELTCAECERIFANPDSLKAHRNFSHGGVPRKRYIYMCAACGRVFRQRALLHAHERAACGAGPLFPCSECGKAFSSQHVLRSHLRVHQPHKALLCKFCGKRFHWQGQLKIHERSHTGERPFKCVHCPKAFAYRESLITHTTLHTGIKPYLCEACGSRFSCVGNLLKHRRTHANTCGLVSSQVKTELLLS